MPAPCAPISVACLPVAAASSPPVRSQAVRRARPARWARWLIAVAAAGALTPASAHAQRLRLPIRA